jgi:hypothetical protein
MVTPMHSKPLSFMSAAATELSTPPDNATQIRLHIFMTLLSNKVGLAKWQASINSLVY